ncbi:MAG: hypothetical protein RMJ49_06720 [Bacteroidia bacterium]|nr:hypothetical protein [Bacteroidia bacterium]
MPLIEPESPQIRPAPNGFCKYLQQAGKSYHSLQGLPLVYKDPGPVSGTTRLARQIP